jgi:hypothetical protein
MPALKKKRLITQRHPAVGMPRSVADDIRFGLDDAAADHTFGRLPHQDLAIR